MEKVQWWAAVIALSFVTIILASTVLAICFRSAATDDLLSLTELILSWPVAAGGLVFGGGQAILRAWRK